MGVFPGYGTNLPTQLWIISRYVQAATFIIAPLLVGRRLPLKSTFLIYALVSVLLLAFVFYWKIFPASFVEGTGLTTFKKVSEYAISVILAGSLYLLWRKRQFFDRGVLKLLSAAIIATIVAELLFTFYISAYGLSNLLGHFAKIIAFYFVYKAIIGTGLTKPYNLLFRELKQSEESLEQRAEEMEQEIAMRKRAEQTLRDAQEQLVQQGKLAAIGQLASGIAHELRNPLAAINNAIYYLGMKANGGDEETSKFLTIIKNEVFRASGIIEGLLSYARNRELNLQKVDVKDYLDRLLLRMPQFDNVKITVEQSGNVPKISIDAQQMELVFSNIIKNAVQAMPKSGVLSISVDSVAKFVQMDFCDNGCGIAPENISKIFEPMFTTKSNMGGIGIGLAICRTIVDAHHGVIEAASEPGNGTTFTVKLPY